MRYVDLVSALEQRLFIVGEAGVNHNGSVASAKQLAEIAKEAGCDAVKFQTWITERVYSRDLSVKPDYQLQGTGAEESEYETIKKLELSFAAFRELKAHCDRIGILFFSTPDEKESLDFLLSIGVPLLKTSSQDVTNLPFLAHVAEAGLPTIVSTGACTFEELTEAVETVASRNQQLILLHCVSAYPAPLEELNLNMIPVLKSSFHYPVGFSDHTIGAEAACAAIALGARVFEKHFTLSRSAPGPDHHASMDPEGLADYVRTLRTVFASLGDGRKRIMPSEKETHAAFRRYLVSARAIRAGEKLDLGDILFKKTGAGIPPKHLTQVVGSTAVVDIPADTLIRWEQLEAKRSVV